METINYKDIIIVDNFISSEENDILVGLIEKPECYESDVYIKQLGGECRVLPFQLYMHNGKYYKSLIENCFNPVFDNTLIDIKKRIGTLLDTKHKANLFSVEKYSTSLAYTCDAEIPVVEHSFGVPSEEADNHNNFNKYEGEWGLTSNGAYKYCARIFINNDFEGGNLTFPNQEFDISPVRNRLVLYPCNHQYLYGIRKVNGSSFYLTFWFSIS
jgi:hypothetical protein